MHNNIYYDVFLITTLGHLTVLEICQFAALGSAPLFLKPMLAALSWSLSFIVKFVSLLQFFFFFVDGLLHFGTRSLQIV